MAGTAVLISGHETYYGVVFLNQQSFSQLTKITATASENTPFYYLPFDKNTMDPIVNMTAFTKIYIYIYSLGLKRAV